MTGPRTFLSTLPARGATISTGAAAANGIISIHAPREGSDTFRPARCPRPCHFYPRSPRGERLLGHLQPLPADVISIHAPREGSDRRAVLRAFAVHCISIHAPREGSDG